MAALADGGNGYRRCANHLRRLSLRLPQGRLELLGSNESRNGNLSVGDRRRNRSRRSHESVRVRKRGFVHLRRPVGTRTHVER